MTQRRRFPDGSSTSTLHILDTEFMAIPLAFDDKVLGEMTRMISHEAIEHVPGFRYWDCDERRSMSRPDNIVGYIQRAWEFYWAIRLGVMTGNVCVSIGSGSVNAPATLTTDKYCGESPHAVRYPHPNAFSHMTVDADGMLPFHSNTLGGVIFNHSFEHIEDQAYALSEAYRVIRPQGAICICQPCMAFNLRGTIDPTHTTEWSADEFYRYLTEGVQLPDARIVSHNMMRTDFSFETVIVKNKETVQ